MKYLGPILHDQLTGKTIVNSIVQKSMIGLNFFVDNATFRGKTLEFHVLGTYPMSHRLCTLLVVLGLEQAT